MRERLVVIFIAPYIYPRCLNRSALMHGPVDSAQSASAQLRSLQLAGGIYNNNSSSSGGDCAVDVKVSVYMEGSAHTHPPRTYL